MRLDALIPFDLVHGVFGPFESGLRGHSDLRDLIGGVGPGCLQQPAVLPSILDRTGGPMVLVGMM